MLSLLASIAALAVGPLLYLAVKRSGNQRARVVLDVVIVLAVAGIVLLHILPDCLEIAGWPAVVALVAGLLVPTLIEQWLRRLTGSAHAVVGAVVVIGIAVHALMDGVGLALASGDRGIGHGMPVAVALHRIPVGLILWWLMRPRGLRAAVLVLAAIGLATGVGFVAGGVVSAGMESAELAVFQALIAGALLHVAVHQHHHTA